MCNRGPRRQEQRSTARLFAVLALGLLAASLLAPAPALGSAGRDGGVYFHRVHSRPHLRAFWTPRRIRAAQPLSVLRYDGTGGRLLGAGGNAAPAAAGPTAHGTDTGDPTQYPNRVNGVVVGQFPAIGGFECSGSVINTSAGNVVLTAGHCLVDPDTGFSATNLVFVPGFRDSSEPFGEWTVTSFAVPSQWQNSVGPTQINPGDEAGDMGMMQIANRPSDGASVQGVVGAAGIAFNQARSQTYMQYGYPAESPYDGSRLYETTSPLVTSDNNFSPPTLGIASDFTGGSSGGPWLVGCSPAAMSVTDYTYSGQAGVMYGPYFGSIAQQLFTQMGGSANGASATTSLGCPAAASSSKRFSIGKVFRNRRRGTAVLRVTVPSAGVLQLTGRGLVKVTKHPHGQGTVALRVRAKGSKLANLRGAGRVRVNAKVAFTPTGGQTLALFRQLLLLRRG
jgi:V8-like Glu-specific endopeptidase